MAKFDRAKAREELLRRTQQSAERREGEMSYKYFATDKDLPLWRCGITKEDPHLLDIIPFVAGSQYPRFAKDPVNEGDLTYYLDIYVHQNIGPGKAQIVCPQRNYGKPCPICEDIEAKVKDGWEWEDYSGIAPKRRCVYNVWVLSDPKEEAKGVQIWEASHRFSEKQIQAQAKAPRGGGVIPFASPEEDGHSISFSVENDEYRTVSGMKLVPRDYVIPDEVLEDAFTLDELIVLLEYAAIFDIYYGEGAYAEMKAEKDQAKRSQPVPQERKASGPLGGAGGVRRRGEGDVPEPEVPPGRSPRGGNPGRAPAVGECPGGGRFGADIDTLPNCQECSEYNACAEAFNEKEAARRPAPPTAGSGGAGRRDLQRRSRR